ncbi:MAG: choice-of-anchor E domain-containing protein [Opitutia bacterium]|jgi:hypothetical protein
MRIPILGLLAAAATASAATTTDNNSATDFAGDSTWTNLNLAQFDATLGTLTGVTITVNSLTIGGSFNATAVGAPLTINGATGSASIRGSNVNLGFTQINSSGNALTLSPGVPFIIAEDDNQTFNISSITTVTSQSYSISASFFSAYIGNGSVTFQVRNSNPNVNSDTNGDVTYNRSQASGAADMTVTYTYTPVPEPSTYGMILGGLALAGAALRRRRQSA